MFGGLHGGGLRINRCDGILASLNNPTFSDVQVRLPSGKETLHCHRLVLAAASPVLCSKFGSEFQDAKEPLWAPDFGSGAAWTWLLRWMYGADETLPPEMIVEVLLLADRLEIQPLLASVETHDIRLRDGIVGQILEAWACPAVLEKVAARCIPSQLGCADCVERSLAGANVPNAVLFLKHVPVLTELDRLHLIQWYQRCRSDLPENWWLETVRWETWPSKALDAAHEGDLAPLELPEGVSLKWSPALQTKMRRSMFERCTRLERLGATSCQITPQGLIAHHGAPFIRPGIFHYLRERTEKLDVQLSSFREVHGLFYSSCYELFELDTHEFGTEAELNPWIAVTPERCTLRPLAVGLKHGDQPGHHVCESFALEARRRGDEWQELLRITDQPLSVKGHVFELPHSEHFFKSIRVRMISPQRRPLMVSWLEVFGHLKTDLPGWTGAAA
ncbi:unnamed protein product [Effrenium voratum]|nr:unnamed protein product [Effrenium voratum]